jgi:predicted metal-dependent peptidase
MVNDNKQVEKIARDIMAFSRNQLLVNLRFLDFAISQLEFRSVDVIPTLVVDGRFLLYNPWFILERYSMQKENVLRDYLHMIFHCLFHHPFINKLVHQGCWDLACDIAAENAINDLGLSVVTNARQAQGEKLIAQLKDKLHLITAEKLYRYYLDQDLSDAVLAGLRQDFYADDHSMWYQLAQQKGNNGSKQGDGQAKWQTQAGGSQGKQGEKQDGVGSGQEKSQQYTIQNALANLQTLQEIWQDISQRAQVDIETASQQWGDQKGGLHQGLNQVTREKYDYVDFLKRFSVLGEEMQVNDEEFDLVFYTYGLNIYENMPLIEPLEYKEVKRIRDFVIAIDTSGSVQGELVQAFIQKTYNILIQTENFFKKVNIHIIQCDAAVQVDTKITNLVEFEQYIQSMTLSGFGGTDFRPVFAYVDQLVEQHEFDNLKGLIYFTDGYGTYPSRKPAFDTAFVFLDEDYVEIPEVPHWAIKLVLSSDEVMEL